MLIDKRFIPVKELGTTLHMANHPYRISPSFTICDLAAWEREHGTKPEPLTASTYNVATAIQLCEEDLVTITDKEAFRLEEKMRDLCETVAMDHYGDEAEGDTAPYFAVWHPQEKRFYGFKGKG